MNNESYNISNTLWNISHRVKAIHLMQVQKIRNNYTNKSTTNSSCQIRLSHM